MPAITLSLRAEGIAMRFLLIAAVWTAVVVQATTAAEIERLAEIQFVGAEPNEDLSALALLNAGQTLVVGADEGRAVQVFQRDGENRFALQQAIPLHEDDEDEEEEEEKKEIDIEGAACEGDTVVVLGSHSRKRPSVKANKTYEENLKRLKKNKREKSRENLFRFRLNADGELDSEIEPASLRDFFEQNKILKDFLEIPSKENGIDLEAVAIKDGRVFVGFRGPVLRDGYVPVLDFDFDDPDEANLRFANLGGRGFRDLIAVEDGFLLIGGPVGDAPVSYELYFWNGEDCVPGTGITRTLPESLGTIPLPSAEAKPEGITVLSETDSHYEVLIVFDGIAENNAGRYRVEKPGS